MSPYPTCHNHVTLPAHCLSQLCHVTCPLAYHNYVTVSNMSQPRHLNCLLFVTTMSSDLSTIITMSPYPTSHNYVTLPAHCLSQLCHLTCPLAYHNYVIISNMSQPCHLNCLLFVTTMSSYLSTIITMSPYPTSHNYVTLPAHCLSQLCHLTCPLS